LVDRIFTGNDESVENYEKRELLYRTIIVRERVENARWLASYRAVGRSRKR
jgi:hypothetical protein